MGQYQYVGVCEMNRMLQKGWFPFLPQGIGLVCSCSNVNWNKR